MFVKASVLLVVVDLKGTRVGFIGSMAFAIIGIIGSDEGVVCGGSV